MMLTLHTLAATARGRREELGLTQQELATRIGASRNLVRRFEAGEGATSIAAVLRIVDALGLSLEIGTGPSERPTGSLDLDSLLDAYRR
jgi:transcriptional regulator with XRE-family HTH domain